jgi:hypothetical protein
MNEITSLSSPWDPLAPLETEKPDPGIVFAAQRREIRNILKSYTGYYDVFAEMLQNALDAVEKHYFLLNDSPYAAGSVMEPRSAF